MICNYSEIRVILTVFYEMDTCHQRLRADSVSVTVCIIYHSDSHFHLHMIVQIHSFFRKCRIE
jgi:hypothetical protein